MTTPLGDSGPFADRDLIAVAAPVRRVVAARLRDPHSVDDVVQETLARLLDARERLDGSALLPYAVVTARNLAAEHGRTGLRQRRHLHRVLDLREPELPEESALRSEEQRALSTALGTLPARDRSLLVAHEVEDQDTATLAEAAGSTPGGVAARLARTRARLRVDYLVALHRGELPTLRCRPVLLSLSTGDRRRQKSLRAGDHLLACPACSQLSESLLARGRPLAALLPWLWFPSLAAAGSRLVRRRSVQIGSATAATAAVAAAGALALHQARTPVRASAGGPPSAPAATGSPAARPAPAAAKSGILVAGRQLPRTGAGTSLGRYVGEPVRATGVRVLAVPADEGFWVSAPTGGRLWVQLPTATGSRPESSESIRPGQRLSFTGTIVRNDRDFAHDAGVTAAEGAAQLAAQGVHVAAAGQPSSS